MPNISELDCGMTNPHIEAIMALMKKENTFLFVRPTEYDSTRLIKEGFATKSMDIHDKSSNWGPHAGMVPCDPAFSKKLEGKPNETPNYTSHDKAHPMHLRLADALLGKFTGKKIEAAAGYSLARDGTVSRGAGGLSDVRFYRALGAPTMGPKSTLFCLKPHGSEWEVFWVHWNDQMRTRGTLVKLYVWAYDIQGVRKPVTGDYDLWMVAPFWRRFSEHGVIDIETDEHGKSAATKYITRLLTDMNYVCGCAHNPVFRHGAESQNYGFTQSLDRRLAMFTPSGDAYPVSIEVMPTILSEIQSAGYLVYWNKRYGDIDPKLSGKNWKQREDSAARALAAFAQYRAELNELAEQHGGQLKSTPAERAAAGQTGVGRARFRHAVRQVVARGDRDIRKFHNELVELMEGESRELRVLQLSDFPPEYTRLKGDSRRMLQELQKGVVDATSATGTGQADPAQLSRMLDEWKERWEGYFN